ncbi:MAG: ATP-dependent RecD-like DNA helicase, partial [Allomuricauda sp.]
MTDPTPSGFLEILHQKFPHEPTLKQNIALEKLSNFVFAKKEERVFLLKGFAGTGKTTLVGTVVNSLWKIRMGSVLLAPTGRAAKVMSVYSGTKAFTIHKKIYFPKKQSGGGIQFVLAPNKHRNTLFIVDEASMIPDTPADSKLFENGSLLDDLMYYVYSGHNCKLLLIGDTAQLPPVKLDLSPALEEDRIALNYNKEVESLELDEVMRQTHDSGILYNATHLREQLQTQFYDSFQFELGFFKDV